jgi:hypothetical protein
MTDLSKTLRDAGYIAIGMVVVAVQKSQVRRVELSRQFESQRKQVEAQAAEARDQLTKLVKGVEERWEPAIRQLEARLDELEQRLPEQAATVVKQARAVQADLVQRFSPPAA